MTRAASEVWQYADPENHDLKHALAACHGVRPENIVVGEGIDALLGYLNRLLVVVEDFLAPGHVDRTPYLLAMAGGDKNPLDSWVVWVTVGAILGGFFAGWRNGRIKVETNRGPRMPVKLRWVTAFIGGAFMGYGARFARGCTSGQALSGGAVLSVGSWVFMMAFFGGAYGMAIFFRRQWT